MADAFVGAFTEELERTIPVTMVGPEKVGVQLYHECWAKYRQLPCRLGWYALVESRIRVLQVRAESVACETMRRGV